MRKVQITSGAYGYRPEGSLHVQPITSRDGPIDLADEEAERLVKLGVGKYTADSSPEVPTTPVATPEGGGSGGRTTENPPDGEGGSQEPETPENRLDPEDLIKMTRTDMSKEIKSTEPAAIIDAEEFSVAEKSAEESAYTYIHKFKTPFAYEGKTYEELTFDWGKLTGDDGLAIENEMQQLGKPVIVPTFSGEYLVRMVTNWQELQTEQDNASGSIADLKTDFTATMQALASSISGVLAARPVEIDLLRIYTQIDSLPEGLLDILAYDFKIDWYDPTYMCRSLHTAR